jgi:hypothetical protein
MITLLNNLKETAPSIFATKAHQKMSDKYQFVPTYELIEKFMNDGWELGKASQVGKGLFSKHQVRMRHGEIPNVGDCIPELILTNSHDGSTTFSVSTGLHRLVCSNGLTVPTSLSQSFKIRHTNFDMGEVRKVTDEFAEQLPIIGKSVEKMSSKILTLDEQLNYVEKAKVVRWVNGQKPVGLTMEEILQPLRVDDADPTMWNTFNVVQEKFVRGGLKYKGKVRMTTMKELKNISSLNKVNTQLWELAESYC